MTHLRPPNATPEREPPRFARWLKKTQDELEKTQLPAFGDVGLCPTIAEILSLDYIVINSKKDWALPVFFFPSYF